MGVPRALAVELADRLVTLASEQHRAETRRVPEALLLEMQAVGKRLAAAMPAERRAVVS